MQAGRELDALVAVKVMGWERHEESWYDEEGIEGTRFVSPGAILDDLVYGWGKECEYDHLETIPNFSTSIADAWQVVEKLYELDPHEGTYIQIYGPLSDGYKVSLIWEHHDGPLDQGHIFAETAPLGICLAALKAVGE